MNRGIPDPKSAAAMEGTAVHALCERILNYHIKTKEKENGLRARFKPGTTIKFVPEEGAKQETLTVDSDHLDNAMTFVNLILGMLPATELFIEKQVSLDHIREDMGGTLDAGLYHKKERRVTVIDYKNGFTPVHLYKNPAPIPFMTEITFHGTFTTKSFTSFIDVGINTQLLMYAAGLVHEIGWNKVDEVVLAIVQPRCFEVEPVQQLTIPAVHLQVWMQDVLWNAAVGADFDDAPLAAGEHCRFCRAAPTCPEFAKQASALAGADFAAVAPRALPSPQKLTIDQVRNILNWAPMIDSWLRDVEAWAFDQLQKGKVLEGFKLVRKRSNREWPTEDVEELYEKLRKLGMDKKLTISNMYEKKLRSPAQLEKIIGKDPVNALAIKPEGGLTLATESDKREAVDPASDFADIL